MNICALHLSSHTHSPKPLHSTPTPTPKLPSKTPSNLKPKPKPKPKPTALLFLNHKPNHPITPTVLHENHTLIPKWVFLSGASLGLALLILGVDGGQHEALAFGPEGPLVEEFWDNMRRYGLYILTVSTGVIYTVFQPIVELLKNPITVVVVGSGYLVSQVLNAMVFNASKKRFKRLARSVL